MQERATIFGDDSALYDRARPRYPDAAIDRIVEGDPRVAVEVGCGTGIASAQVGARGVRVIGIEPDARMAALARDRGIEVHLSRLEDWAPVTCDVMFAAQSWHWVDPRRGAEIAAGVIRPDGRWMALWNSERDAEVAAVCRAVYRAHAPGLLDDHVGGGGDHDFVDRLEATFSATRSFGPVTVEHLHWTDSITGRGLVDRLGSHSSHRLQDDRTRQALRDALLDAFGADARLEVRYVTEVLSCVRLSV